MASIYLWIIECIILFEYGKKGKSASYSRATYDLVNEAVKQVSPPCHPLYIHDPDIK